MTPSQWTREVLCFCFRPSCVLWGKPATVWDVWLSCEGVHASHMMRNMKRGGWEYRWVFKGGEWYQPMPQLLQPSSPGPKGSVKTSLKVPNLSIYHTVNSRSGENHKTPPKCFQPMNDNCGVKLLPLDAICFSLFLNFKKKKQGVLEGWKEVKWFSAGGTWCKAWPPAFNIF